MSYLLSIDPGEKYNAAAFWNDGTLDWLSTQSQDELSDQIEDQIIPVFQQGGLVVVIEGYYLYPWMLQQQGFSEVRTVEMIGVVRRLCRRSGVELVVQKATIKKPTFAIAAYNDVAVPGRNQHERDAWAHGYYYLHHQDLRG